MPLCRAARFCLSAAYGGQIVLPIEMVQKVVSEWTQRPCPPMPEKGARPVRSVSLSRICLRLPRFSGRQECIEGLIATSGTDLCLTPLWHDFSRHH